LSGFCRHLLRGNALYKRKNRKIDAIAYQRQLIEMPANEQCGVEGQKINIIRDRAAFPAMGGKYTEN